MIKEKVSVVLPVHYVNRKWLGRSITSVLQQDYKNLELIVVNDKATENIDEFIRSFGITKYVKNKENMKLPYSLNRGFKKAEGEYHTWTSADNFMMPRMITKLVNELRSHPDIAIIIGRSRYIDEDDKPVDFAGRTKRNIPHPSGCDTRALKVDRAYTYFSTLGACFLYRSEVWEKLGGYAEQYHGAEDYDFWVRASREYKIQRLPYEEAPLYAYRVHKHSISRTVAYCYSNSRIKILKQEQMLSPGDKDIKRAIHYFQIRYLVEWRKRKIDRPLRSLKNKIREVAMKIAYFTILQKEGIK